MTYLQLKQKLFNFMDGVAYWWGRYGSSSPSTKGFHGSFYVILVLSHLIRYGTVDYGRKSVIVLVRQVKEETTFDDAEDEPVAKKRRFKLHREVGASRPRRGEIKTTEDMFVELMKGYDKKKKLWCIERRKIVVSLMTKRLEKFLRKH